MAKPNEEIWEGIFSVVYNRESARDKDFKDWARSHHHSSKSIYPARKRLMQIGVVARHDKRYALVPIYFEQKNKILLYLKFLKSNNPGKIKTGALGLCKVYASDAALLGRKQNMEEFLQSTRIRAKIKGEDVIDVTQITEVWTFFLEVLNDVKRYSFVRSKLVRAIQGAFAIAKRIEKANPPVSPLTSRLNKALVESVRLAIFALIRSEIQEMYEQTAIKLIVMLRDLDDSKTQLVAIIKALLEESIKRGDASSLEKPLPDESCPLGERGINDIWHKPGDYSDLFKAIYYLLHELGEDRMETLLEEWADQSDVNLSSGAQLFLNVPLSEKKRVIRSGMRLTCSILP